MRRALSVLGVAGVVLVSVLVSSASAGESHARALPAHGNKRVCAAARGATAACASRVVTAGRSAKPLATTSYTYGYTPQNLASAYKWADPTDTGTGWVGNGQTVAIVDAYHNPNAFADLTAYRAQFGLPPCTTESGCFRQVNQNGTISPMPSGN